MKKQRAQLKRSDLTDKEYQVVCEVFQLFQEVNHEGVKTVPERDPA